MQTMLRGTDGSRTRPPRRRWWGPRARPVPDCRCRNAFGELGGEVEEVQLDVRGLSMDDQIGQTLARMEALPAGKRLRQIGPSILWPLLAMLETRGYRYRLVGRREDGIHMLIWSLVHEARMGPR